MVQVLGLMISGLGLQVLGCRSRGQRCRRRRDEGSVLSSIRATQAAWNVKGEDSMKGSFDIKTAHGTEVGCRFWCNIQGCCLSRMLKSNTTIIRQRFTG